MPTRVKFDKTGRHANIWQAVYEALYDFDSPRSLVSIPMSDRNAAISMKIQLNKFRKYLREEEGESAYDSIAVREGVGDPPRLEFYTKAESNEFSYDIVDDASGEVIETVRNA